MEKIIKLNRNDARNLYKTNPELRDTILKEFSNRELGIDTFPESWESLKTISGSFINPYSDIRSGFILDATKSNRNMIPTREDAESQLAESQLRQLAKAINDDETEEEWIDWDNEDQPKEYAFYSKVKNDLFVSTSYIYNVKAIYFKRRKDLERSLVEHKELWLRYFKAI